MLLYTQQDYCLSLLFIFSLHPLRKVTWYRAGWVRDTSSHPRSTVPAAVCPPPSRIRELRAAICLFCSRPSPPRLIPVAARPCLLRRPSSSRCLSRPRRLRRLAAVRRLLRRATAAVAPPPLCAPLSACASACPRPSPPLPRLQLPVHPLQASAPSSVSVARGSSPCWFCAAALLVLLSLCSLLLVLVLVLVLCASALLCSWSAERKGGAAPTSVLLVVLVLDVLLFCCLSCCSRLEQRYYITLLLFYSSDWLLLVFCFSAAPEVSCGWTVVQHRFFI